MNGRTGQQPNVPRYGLVEDVVNNFGQLRVVGNVEGC